MKIITVGDQHSKSVWKQIDPNKHDKIIFLGDAVDDFEPTTDKQIYDNLADIIEFKKTNPDKIELLWGNHEMSYLFEGFECSGYRPSMKVILKDILTKNQDLFKYACQIKNYLFTHAGLHTGFIELLKKQGVDLTGPNYADQLNNLDKKLLNIVGRSRGGWEYNGGILWCDKSEWWINFLPDNLHQIVGHSKVPSVKNNYNIKTDNKSITFCDCLDIVTEFYELEIEL